MIELTHQRLLEVLHYNRKTGVFTWLLHRGPNARAGSVAGSLSTHGEIQIKIDGRLHLANRLAVYWVTGVWPEGKEVDHKDRNKQNNSWTNLRVCTSSQNSMNKGLIKTNTSGAKGVVWYEKLGKWNAFVMINKKRKHLGYFNSWVDAVAARQEAVRLHYRDFAGAQ